MESRACWRVRLSALMDISSENTSFNYLRGSPDFLNKVLNSISSAVLLLDKDMRLQAFNDALRTMFSSAPEEYLLYQKCGNAIGCANPIEQQQECGEADQCCNCELRKAAILTYCEGVEFYKNRLQREFLRRDGTKVRKYLQFSTRRVRFNQDPYVLLIIEDLTDLILKEDLIREQQHLIEQLRQEDAGNP